MVFFFLKRSAQHKRYTVRLQDRPPHSIAQRQTMLVRSVVAPTPHRRLPNTAVATSVFQASPIAPSRASTAPPLNPSAPAGVLPRGHGPARARARGRARTSSAPPHGEAMRAAAPNVDLPRCGRRRVGNHGGGMVRSVEGVWRRPRPGRVRACPEDSCRPWGRDGARTQRRRAAIRGRRAHEASGGDRC